jgi:hypothetical protein
MARKSGSEIAKSGFKNEHVIVEKLNNFSNDADAQQMLEAMGFPMGTYSSVEAYKVPGTVKADIAVKVDEKQIYISAKKCSDADFNQVCRHSVEKWGNLVGLDPQVVQTLSVFTGEATPGDYPHLLVNGSTKRPDRATLMEIEPELVSEAVNALRNNLKMFLEISFRGLGDAQPDFMIITQEKGDENEYYTFAMDEVLEFYLGDGSVTISPRGSFYLGGKKMSAQRKGGSGGPTNLQFKFRPSYIIEGLSLETTI